MKKTHFVVAVALALFFAPTLRADAPPTPDELKKLFDDANYKDLLQKLNKALAVKGPDAAQYDKFSLYTMKGEASLHTHSKSAAADAFKQAATVATKPEDVALAQGTAELITEANGSLKYLPKKKASKDDKPEPIDIVEADSRKKALDALETDLSAKVKIKIDAVIKGNSLADVMTMVKSKDLSDLRAVELAASGSNADSKQMLGDLGEHASSLMDGALDKMVDEIKADVESINSRGGGGGPPAAKPGAVPAITTIAQFEQAMTNIESNAKQIQDFAISMKGMFGDGTDLKPVVEKSTQVRGEAKHLLDQAKKSGG